MTRSSQLRRPSARHTTSVDTAPSRPERTSLPSSRVVAVGTALPEHRYPQAQVTQMLTGVLGVTDRQRALVERVHRNAGVGHRHLVRPLEDYADLGDFGARNDIFLAEGVELGSQALLQALADAGLDPEDVDLIVSTTVTGIAVPSIESRVAARIGLRDDVKRVPLMGLGCVAGAAGIARVHDYLVGHPDEVAVLLSVELCSLTLQRDDTSTANIVASGLFGDGAAAVVLSGAHRPPGAGAAPQPLVLASRSRRYPDTERAMGWDVGPGGLRIVLGVEVPDLVRDHVRDDVDSFLARHDLTRSDIGWWVAHPGGPKVLEAMAEALEVERDALGVTWASLDDIGNLSSASVLHVLRDTLRDRPPVSGTYGMLLAMGPGFCLEMVLLQA